LTVYRRVDYIAGVRVVSDSKIKAWGGWPDDAVQTIYAWNKARRLTFANEAYIVRFATGFNTYTLKCVECGVFFNASSACRFDGKWYCDDCMINLARAEQAAA
jgi:hypothetical protein